MVEKKNQHDKGQEVSIQDDSFHATIPAYKVPPILICKEIYTMYTCMCKQFTSDAT